MRGLSLNKSSIIKLNPTEIGLAWAVTTPRPGTEAARIKTPKTKEKTDSGKQMLSAYGIKGTYELKGSTEEKGIKQIQQRLDQVMLNSRRSASIKEARQQIRKGITIDGEAGKAGTKVPAYAVITDKAPINKRSVAHEIKNIFPKYPHLVRVSNEVQISLAGKEGEYKPRKLETARINRLKSRVSAHCGVV